MIQLLNTHFLFNIVCNKKEYMQKIYVVYKNTMDISRKNSRILFLTELPVFFFFSLENTVQQILCLFGPVYIWWTFSQK